MSQTTYRFTLQPYKPGQKVACPSCGQQKCYVRYQDNETGSLLPMEYGRCERVNSCGYHKAPDSSISSELRAEEAQGKPVFVPRQFVDENIVRQTFSHYDTNPFALFLARQFGSRAAAEAIRRYHIGTAKNGGTIFWSKNQRGQYCNGKKIYYNPDGKRNREIPPCYTHLTTKGYKICLFGEHLISDKPIAIVESEKSAVICSIYRPELTWLACGGANGLTFEKLAPLTKKQVLLFPDSDQAGRAAFLVAAGKLRNLPAYPELVDMLPDCTDGTDIADILLTTPVTTGKLIIGPEGYPEGWN